MGIERVIDNLKRQDSRPPDAEGAKVLIAHMGDRAKDAGIELSSKMRLGGIAAVLAPSSRGLKSQLRYASAIGATHAVIIGDDELAKGVVVLRDLGRGHQEEVSEDDLPRLLASG